MLRLHILALPHTITRDEYSHCAFTGKVLRFSPMMISRGFEVYHYGIETSTPKATKHIDVLSKKEWEDLRVESYKFLHPEITLEDARNHLNDVKNFVGDLGNCTTPLYRDFNQRLHPLLKENYRSCATDLVCLPFGRAHDPALHGLNVICVESGIGYPDSYQNFRVFESYCKLHMAIIKEQKHCQHYWFVIPNYYDTLEWPLNLNPDKKTIGYFGRICYIKGLNIFVEMAVRFRHIDFVICGQGDPLPYIDNHPNIFYKAPIHGKDRGLFLSSLTALVAPSMYAEPFCGVNVEAQLCGTPVISNDFGAFVETVEPFKTGMLCHTLADFCKACQMALDGEFDRQYIHDRAVRKYDMYNVAKQYEYAFKNILNISNGKNGWYSTDCFIDLLREETTITTTNENTNENSNEIIELS
jgi:glycosyltransferase involved in cell wall biosynthesis